jgi:uncharacterized membrane protein YkgB
MENSSARKLESGPAPIQPHLIDSRVERNPQNANTLQSLGEVVLRYGLAAVLIWVGGLKFTSYEAQGIQPLVAHSPLLSWVYSLMSVEGFARLLGSVEIAIGALIALRAFSPRASMIGSFAAIAMFLTTLSFLLSTPGVVQEGYSFPALSPQIGQFLAKDLVFLGAAIWSAGEAWRASLVHKDVTASRIG